MNENLIPPAEVTDEQTGSATAMSPSNGGSVAMSVATSFLGELGFFNWGQKLCVLSWTMNPGHVTLTSNEGTVLFSVSPSEIQKAHLSLNQLDMTIQGKHYRMFAASPIGNVAYGAGMVAGVGAAGAIGVGAVEMSQAHVDELVALVGQAGGKAYVSHPIAFFVKWMTIGLLILFVAVLVLVASIYIYDYTHHIMTS